MPDSFRIPKNSVQRRAPARRRVPVVRRTVKRRGVPRGQVRGRPAFRSPRPIAAPVALGYRTAPNRAPRMMSTARGMIVQHQEEFYPCSPINTDYNVTTLQVNPGVNAVFPWLSQVAGRYESYKFRTLTFKYVPSTATSQEGTVAIAFEFDVSDPPPTNMTEVRAYHDRVAGNVWTAMSVAVDLAQGDKLPAKYIRVGLPTPVIGPITDRRLSDVGSLYLVWQGVSAALHGYFEVQYTVELYTAQIEQPIGGRMKYDCYLDNLFYTYRPDLSDCVCPFTTNAMRSMTFHQRFEGTIILALTGTGLNALSVVISGPAGGTVAYAWTGHCIIDAPGTSLVQMLYVRALPYNTLTWTPSFTTLTNVSVVISSASYDALMNITGHVSSPVSGELREAVIADSKINSLLSSKLDQSVVEDYPPKEKAKEKEAVFLKRK